MLNLDKLALNNARMLACQAIEQAHSGHPGIVLGATPVVYSLYAHHLNVSPRNANFFLRDRFVLSAGHGSAMLYANLHMFGFPISMDNLKSFRQLHSLCAGHPEYDSRLGIEATTGPLGQGVANAVGMALAERHMAAVFNKPDAQLFDNYTYALVGDGCLMEGVASEALSFAATQKLNKLIVLYDFNKITIDGKIDITFAQNTERVFRGYGFNVLTVENGNDLQQINAAINEAKHSDKPTLIVVHSIIGFGSTLAGSEKAHGAPLGQERMEALAKTLDINVKPFEILPQVAEHMQTLQKRFNEVELFWQQKINNYKTKYPNDYEKLQKYLSNNFSNVSDVLAQVNSGKNSISTRELGALMLSKLGEVYPNIIGGAADLVSSTKTLIINGGKLTPQTPEGRNIYYGIREFAMSAISNGIALYGGLKPFASTFLVFSDYMKAGIRLSAIMNLPVLYVFTHDSIGVGEDGPTHQSVEQLTALRSVPNLLVYRPANEAETKAGYAIAVESKMPTAMILTRQNINNFESSAEQAKLGAYVLEKENGKLDVVLMASGSEVSIVREAKTKLQQMGINSRVVSVPCMELFNAQSEEYKREVLPLNCNVRISVEAGATLPWYKYVGLNGLALGIDNFGLSGKSEDVYNYFCLTAECVTQQVVNLLKK